MEAQLPRFLAPSEGVLAGDRCHLPAISDVARLIAKAKTGRAVGEDCIPAEFYKADPMRSARMLHPLLLKSIIYSYEPFLWRGGLIHCVWKGKEDPAKRDAHRAVVLADASAKFLHAFGRAQALP
eukprot:9622643-Alexandrium_andersonii.AAC.1